MERLAARVSEVAGTEVELERPKDPTHGDFATNVAMRSAKAIGRPPRELAQELAGEGRGARRDRVGRGRRARASSTCGSRTRSSSMRWREVDENYGGGWAEQPERVQIEMVSANPTGPIVVSAARNGAYGDCVARLLEFGGHTVSREYYYNDAGAQMDRFRASIDALRRGEPVPEDGYQGEYVVAARRRGGRSGAEDARVDRGDDGAIPHPLRQLGAAERARAAAAGVPAAPRHLREGRRASGRGRLLTATSRTGC